MLYQKGALYVHKESKQQYRLIGLGRMKDRYGHWCGSVTYESADNDYFLHTIDQFEFEKLFAFVKLKEA